METQKKKKYAFWLNQDTKSMVEDSFQKDNCQSQSEFVENAIRFYTGYLSAKDATEYLAPVLAQVLRGTLDVFSAHVNRNLFRLAVEEAKTWNIIAGLIHVAPDQLKHIHNKAIGEVKRLKGTLTYEQLYKDPVPLEYDLDTDALGDDMDVDE
ncbi:MAG: hypothetical protein Q4C22_00955 [Bacillota bacterium]|nr:hypothetical protein [Bacillota bacterium]